MFSLSLLLLMAVRVRIMAVRVVMVVVMVMMMVMMMMMMMGMTCVLVTMIMLLLAFVLLMPADLVSVGLHCCDSVGGTILLPELGSVGCCVPDDNSEQVGSREESLSARSKAVLQGGDFRPALVPVAIFRMTVLFQ